MRFLASLTHPTSSLHIGEVVIGHRALQVTEAMAAYLRSNFEQVQVTELPDLPVGTDEALAALKKEVVDLPPKGKAAAHK